MNKENFNEAALLLCKTLRRNPEELAYLVKLTARQDWPNCVDMVGGIPHPFHFREGMQIRNWLRRKGFGETELEVSNLDDVYADIIKKAITLSCGRDLYYNTTSEQDIL